MKKIFYICVALFFSLNLFGNSNIHRSYNIEDNILVYDNSNLDNPPFGWPKFHIDINYYPGCPKGVHDGQKNCIGDCKICYVEVSIGFGMIAPNDGNPPNYTGV
jgi:hypothetical protein